MLTEEGLAMAVQIANLRKLGGHYISLSVSLYACLDLNEKHANPVETGIHLSNETEVWAPFQFLWCQETELGASGMQVPTEQPPQSLAPILIWSAFKGWQSLYKYTASERHLRCAVLPPLPCDSAFLSEGKF